MGEDPGLPNLADVADQTSYRHDPADGSPAATVFSREFSFRPEKHQAIPRGLKYRVCFQAKSSSSAGDETDASEARCVNIHVIQPDAVFDSCSGCASASSGPRLLNVGCADSFSLLAKDISGVNRTDCVGTASCVSSGFSSNYAVTITATA